MSGHILKQLQVFCSHHECKTVKLNIFLRATSQSLDLTVCHVVIAVSWFRTLITIYCIIMMRYFASLRCITLHRYDAVASNAL